MEKSGIQYLKCEGLQIAASVESNNCEEHAVYYSKTFLFFILRGQLNIKTSTELNTFPAGSVCLVRKHTHGKYFKTWKPEDGSFKMIIFILEDQFIHEVISKINLPTEKAPDIQKFYRIPNTTILTGLMQSLDLYFSEKEEIDQAIVRLKTLETLIGITKAKPELAHIFYEYAKPIQADLRHFMEHNYLEKYTLEQLAQLSGRSISTFNRQFRRTFQKTPHQWIKERRLIRAKQLLLQTELTPSEIYLETGFEDLSHFSRSFKSHFGLNPSQIKTLVR